MSTTEKVRKVVLFVELIGEPASGKTHLACTFPKIAMFDTSPKKESWVVMRKLVKDAASRYFPIRSFGDVKTALGEIKKRQGEFSTVVVDTSPDLREIAAKEYLGELNAKRQAIMPPEYRHVNEKVNGMVDEVTAQMGMNLVFTSQMKDEYSPDGKGKTGRRIRKGIPDINSQADIRLFLSISRMVDPKTMQYVDGVYERKCRVLKNRFRNMADKLEWKEYLDKMNWEGIKGLTDFKEGEAVE